MTDLVKSEDIEAYVGVKRNSQDVHYGRAVSATGHWFILHSQKCIDSGIDLRDCEYSLALDRKVNLEAWLDRLDMPVVLRIWNGRLIPDRNAEINDELAS